MRESGTLLHILRLEVRWGDMDAAGHVNNATYFTYFEQARAAWLESIGAAQFITTAETGPVIVHTACEFLRPIVYPAGLEVRLYAGTVGRSSMETYYEIVDAADPARRHANGSAKVVWVDRRTGKSVPLPEAIRGRLPAGA